MDVQPEISILKGIYYVFTPRFSSIAFGIYKRSLRNFIQSRKHKTFDGKVFEFRYISYFLGLLNRQFIKSNLVIF